jgi:GTP pyrophosphokinase
MRADTPILVSALLGTDVASKQYPPEFVHEHYGQEITTLTEGVRWLNELTISETFSSGNQAETLRRMVLSMVKDVRVVLVKLAYRTQRLYRLVKSDSPEAYAIAQETLTIYAPLANRLGLGQLKWELEDVAFRIVEPEAYKRVAKALEENRSAREVYIADFVADLSQQIETHGITGFSVFGRPKHIHSIWRKMRDKRIEFRDLFDVRAVRVLVNNIQQCYSVLGVAHSIFQPISREFDDYIANPKENGYRSLHTAVIGPMGKAVEIQIRTRAMDDDAENGVAAHWAYKEGSEVDPKLQKGINALRQLLDDNDDEQLVEGFSQQLDSHRVYVYTPKGEVIDLTNGSTPLDFAYQIHSEIGHRCRGAKVNGRIMPLTYLLRNGDQVEVLTTRDPGPSRDWLNKSLGYINSSRARSKVRAWFNLQDHEQHVAEGQSQRVVNRCAG